MAFDEPQRLLRGIHGSGPSFEAAHHARAQAIAFDSPCCGSAKASAPRKNISKALAGHSFAIVHTGHAFDPTAPGSCPTKTDCESHRPARQGGRKMHDRVSN